MRELAADVFQIPLTPRDGINAYVIGDVLIDAGVKQSSKKVLKAIAGRTITAHALTHAHIDHAGGSKDVIAALGVPFMVGALDAEACETGRGVTPKAWEERFAHFPAQPVDRKLAEGDEVGGFQVLDTPGHSPGHISLWRESDRVMVCGDVFNNMNLVTTVVGLHQPPSLFTVDPALNRTSMRRIAALEPALLLVGHGPPLRDPAKLRTFTDALAD